MTDYSSLEKTAILVDGGFYLRRASELFGKKSAAARASELYKYCCRHLKGPGKGERTSLYRIFIMTVRQLIPFCSIRSQSRTLT